MVGHALDPLTDIGPVIDATQLDQNLMYIDIGRNEGATLVQGDQVLERATRGYFLAPALFTDSTPEMQITREEIFGPVASVIRVRDFEAALAVANDVSFGLSIMDHDHVPQACSRVSSAGRGGHGHDQRTHSRCRLPCAVRRSQGLKLWPARAGTLCNGVIYHCENCLRRPVVDDED